MSCSEDLFDCIFNPDSVAVIGASKSLLGGAGIFLNALIEMGFPKIFPVNPHEDTISGMKVYPNVKDIPEDVDYAIVGVPAKIVPTVIGDCVEKGVKAAHIFTSGFGETGLEEGKKLQAQIVEIARNKTRIIGPNCMGVYCPASKLSYLPGSPKEGGSVSLISQSGRYATFTIINAAQMGIRFNKIISFGNGCDLESTDFLEYFGNDPETKIIAMYVEGVRDGRRFFDAMKEVAKKKTVIIWKGGRTEEGSKAASSHTGALAGSNLIWESVFKQTGVVQVRCMDELFDTISAFLNLPPPRGRRVAILTGGGGETVTSADACSDEGLELPPLDPGTIEQLRGLLNDPGAICRNPVDYTEQGFSPGIIRKATNIVAGDKNIDILLVLLFLGPGLLRAMMSTSIAQWIPTRSGEKGFSKLLESFIKMSINELIKTKKEIEKPMVVIAPQAGEEQKSVKMLQEAGIPVYPSFECALKALSNFIRYHEFLENV